MRVGGRSYRSIWIEESSGLPTIIDQTLLPHRFELRSIHDVDAAAEAISSMRVRGAPLIGATAAWGMVLAVEKDASDASIMHAHDMLLATRPTAVNLAWALARMRRAVASAPSGERADVAHAEAVAICDEDVASCEAIGLNGLEVLARVAGDKTDGEPLNVLTHCNAGWLATVDWGTALAPIYKAKDAGLDVHVWVDETRPRNQGASLTAFELREMNVPHTVVADNAGGHLMQRGLVDVVLVGSDRTTARGDVCNKIGTYLKALAARDNEVPFYVALPVSTIDWNLRDGLTEIPIEERDASEVRSIVGLGEDGQPKRVQLFAESSRAANPAFDVTPAALVDGLITEWGCYEPTEAALSTLRGRVQAA